MENTKHHFLTLYEPIHESFAKFCHARAYGVMEPEDLMSETILKALENFASLQHEKAFLSYLFTIAKNIVIKKWRRKKFTGVFHEREVNRIQDEGLNPEIRMDIKLLYEAMETLPSAQKEALILFEISGFSIKEVGEIQKSGLSAVKQRLKRGREALAKKLQSKELAHEPIEKRSATLRTIFL